MIATDPRATIVITSQNPDLLKICRLLIPTSMHVYIVDGTQGCWGMRAIKYVIGNAPCALAILLDEDAFVLDFNRLAQLLGCVVSSRTACVGMSDGGIVPIRTHNPNAMNPFFNIIDLKQVRQQWNEADCRALMRTGSQMRELWPPPHVLTQDVEYQFDDYEIYYCFYFWLRSVGRLESRAVDCSAAH